MATNLGIIGEPAFIRHSGVSKWIGISQNS